MNIQDFSEKSRDYRCFQIRQTHDDLTAGRLALLEGYEVLYPTIILCTDTPSHLVVELLGASRRYVTPRLKKHKSRSIDSYLGQRAEGQAVVILRDGFQQLAGGSFELVASREALRERFPHLGQRMRATFTTSSPELYSRAIDVVPAKYWRLHDCTVIQDKDSLVRLRYLSECIGVWKSEPLEAYETYLGALHPTVAPLGVLYVREGTSVDFTAASAFGNTYQMEGLRETTIGEFLRTHEEILKSALGARALLHEPTFEWIRGAKGGERSINPDLMIQRLDGSWDIGELKLPLHHRRSTTRGPRSRRRFIDPVTGGHLAACALR